MVWEGGDIPNRYLHIAYAIDEGCRSWIVSAAQLIDGVERIRFSYCGAKDGVFEMVVYGNTLPVTDELYNNAPGKIHKILSIRDVTSITGENGECIFTQSFWDKIDKAYSDRGIDITDVE